MATIASNNSEIGSKLAEAMRLVGVITAEEGKGNESAVVVQGVGHE